MIKKKAGYEYLLAYKITVPIYDLTVKFCERFVRSFRMKEQMIQAARSGMQNIVEGNKQQGMKGYIKLSGIARGSLEELLKDYHAYARQNNLEIWKTGETGKIRELEKIWKIVKQNRTLPDKPNFPSLPMSAEKATNLMITLVNQANYLVDRLIQSLKEKHQRVGGLTEELYRKRIKYINQSQ